MSDFRRCPCPSHTGDGCTDTGCTCLDHYHSNGCSEFIRVEDTGDDRVGETQDES